MNKKLLFIIINEFIQEYVTRSAVGGAGAGRGAGGA